jgi:hypothetical protein
MISQRLLTRAPLQLSRQARGSNLRSVIQRRLASTEHGSEPLTGAADNAFNRERQRIKAHAEATSGTFVSKQTINFADNWQIYGENYHYSITSSFEYLHTKLII